MKTLKLKLYEVDYIDDLALCLGFFDGLHQGHLQLVKESLQCNLKSAVMTFSISPFFYSKHKKEQLLTPIEERKKILEALGINYLIVLEFDDEVMKLSKEDFIEKVIIKLGAKKIICGFDYSFGYRAEGKVNDLVNLSKGRYEVKVIEKVLDEEEKISSTRIVNLIKNGQIEKANELLTRPYKIIGTVVKGLQNGRKFGFPTANVKPLYSYVLPKNGVYIGKVIVDDKEYLSMINIGRHPTIMELEEPIIETHILDYSSDIYGKRIEVIFYSFLRNEQKFASFEELIKMLSKNKEDVRNYFSKKD